MISSLPWSLDFIFSAPFLHHISQFHQLISASTSLSHFCTYHNPATFLFPSLSRVHLGADHLTWRWVLWFFVSFRIFFSDNTRSRIFFFCRAKREFFFQNLTLGYMTKTLNQIIFFSSTKIRLFFSATLGIRIFF